MFDWIGDALSWVGDKFSDVGTAISEAVWDVMLEWLFNTIYGAVAEFFHHQHIDFFDKVQ